MSIKFLNYIIDDIELSLDYLDLTNPKSIDILKNKFKVLKNEINEEKKSDDKDLTSEKIENKFKNKNEKWSTLVDNDEKNQKREDFSKDIKKLKEDYFKIIDYLRIGKQSKIIRFNFIGNVITWRLNEKYCDLNNIYKISLYPIKENDKVYQIFYYDQVKKQLGIEDKNKTLWYKIGYKERLISYKDFRDSEKFVYYSFVDIEISD